MTGTDPNQRPEHKKAIIGYLACKSCGKWWGLTGRQLQQLMCPWYFTCPPCFLGRTNASAVERDWPDRATPIPERMDTRVAPPDTSAEALAL